MKRNGKTISAHRYVVEQAKGRTLSRSEYVHHKNENKIDNDGKNLEVMSPGAHARHHNQKYPLTKNCEVCGEKFTPAPTKRKRAKTCGKEDCRLNFARNQPTMKWLTVAGVRLNVAEWSKQTGIKKVTLRWRIRRKWKPEEIVSQKASPIRLERRSSI